MHKTILINTLKTLNKRELSKFLEYISSPFFNKHGKITELARYIAKYHPNFEHTALEKSKVIQRLFPKQKISILKLNNLISDLLKLLEGYLIEIELKEQTAYNKKLLLHQLLRRGLKKNFQRTLRAALAQQEKQNIRDHTFFYQNYVLQEEANFYYIAQGRRLKDESLQKKVDQLDIFYLATKLRDSCEMISRTNVIDVTYELHLLDELLEYLKNNLSNYEKYPAITIYYQILMSLLYSDEPQHYQRLILLLEQHAQQFSHGEARGMYDYAQNYCIKQINNGNSEYLNEIFLLFQRLLETKIILENNILAEWDYKNIVTVGLRLRKFEWTEQFIHAYKSYLIETVAENAFAYNLASLYYSQKKYDKSLQLLHQVEFTDVVYYLGAKSLLLKIYYDTDSSTAFYSVIDTVKVYLLRSKLVSVYQRKIYQNLLKFAKKAYKIKENIGYESKEKIEKDLTQLQKLLEENQQTANMNWLREKVAESVSRI